MSGHERRAPLNTDLRNSIDQLENVSTVYADLLLMDTTVGVDMIGISGDFELPEMARHAFRSFHTRPPLHVTGMNLDLHYDRTGQQFDIHSGEVEFDNSYGLAFLDAEKITNQNEPYHPIRLFKRTGRGKITSQDLGLQPSSLVQDFFGQCGITLPLATS
jgi:hypothetical protein